MKNIRSVLAIFFFGSLALSLTTCGGDSSSGPTITTMYVSPSVPAGTTQKLAALGIYSDGTSHDIAPQATWTSSNPSVATVNSSGLATAAAGGSATITATFGNISGSSILTVIAATLSSLSVTPANPSLPAGANQKLTALGTYSDGTIHDMTPQATWTSSNPSVATVNSSGLATGVAAGSATITATFGGISGNAGLTVNSATLSSLAVTPANPSLPAGATQPFIATGTYSDGTSHDITPQVTWTSSNASVATIISSGLATGVAAGSATITATFGGISGNATLTVSSATLSTLLAVPSIPVGAAGQFLAMGIFSDGSLQDVTTLVFWTSSLPSVAPINSSGLATAIFPGSTTLTATTQTNYFPYLVVNLAAVTTLVVTP